MSYIVLLGKNDQSLHFCENTEKVAKTILEDVKGRTFIVFQENHSGRPIRVQQYEVLIWCAQCRKGKKTEPIHKWSYVGF